MICPNCGRELPDTARVCPGCSAVQRVFRRRQAEVDLPEEQDSARVTRRIDPEKEPLRRAGETRRDGRAAGESPDRRAPQQGGRPHPSASRLPVGLSRQAEREQASVRRVRHAPSRVRRKVDARPAMMQPPIYQRSHKRLKRVLLIILLLTLFVGSACGYMLFGSEAGQRLMAQWGWAAARTDAYVTYGRELLEQGYYTRSLEPLGVAVGREPDNVDALVLMGQAYTELGRVEEAKAIYESLISDIAPGHPSAYRNLIRIYQSEGYNAEALTLMKQAAENATNPQEFEVMLREYTPTAPTFSWEGGRYNEEKDLTISIPAGQTVYYTTDGTDPSEAGSVYTEGLQIHLAEGKTTVKAIGFTDNGTPSEQVSADYTIVIPTPAAPKANYASGEYKYAPKVSLRPGDEDEKENKKIIAIYYTLDGRQATTESTLYTGEPIQIPAGRSTLRAIAVSSNGKISYEMQVDYKVEGNLKTRFSSSDTFKNMELYSTGYKTFTKAWGTPESYEVLPEEEWYSPEMESYEAVYEWGTARFLIKKAGASPVLYALDTASTKMTGPRTTKIGMKGSDVVDKFQDLGNPALDEDGNRLLYNLNSAGTTFGTYRKEETGYVIHYYYPVGEKNEIFVELSYYLDEEGNVARIVWQRYMAEKGDEG